MSTTPLTRSETPLIADVKIGPITREALAPFDLDPDIETAFHPYVLPDLPGEYGIGLIVGASGSGKSQLLKQIAEPTYPEWDFGVAIAEHFETATDAVERFYAVGLNTVPVWRLPYEVLSNGQQFRADLARCLEDGSVIDEFTSVVDRNVAASASKAMRTYVDREGLTDIVLVSCHRDIIPWLRPDWIIDTDAGTLTVGETTEAPKWFAEHLTGDAVGRLTLANEAAFTPPGLEPAAPEPTLNLDAVLADIEAASSYPDLRRVYLTHMSVWTPEHTRAATARRNEVSA